MASLLDVWAEEAGIHVEFSGDARGGIVMTVYDTDGDWPGEVVTRLTIAKFRRERIARYFEVPDEQASGV